MKRRSQAAEASVVLALIVTVGLVLAAANVFTSVPSGSWPPSSCSCAGKENCTDAVFMVGSHRDRKAYCALVEDGPDCCAIEPVTTRNLHETASTEE